MRAALDAAESMRGLAEFCGVSLNAVAHWKRVPLQHVLPIEDRYKISRHTLRPDIYGRKPAAPLPGERGYKPRA
ncbi:MAG: YdaS family helix-turn-helix protein [Bacteroidia bacterium]